MKAFKIIKSVVSGDEYIPPENQKKEEINEPEKKTRKSRKSKADYSGLAANIAGIHEIGAKLFQQPLIAIDDNEADALAKSIEGILEHHKVDVNPVVAAYIGFVFTAGTIYLPRLYLIRELKKHEVQQRQQAQVVERAPVSENDLQPATFDDLEKQSKQTAPVVDENNFFSIQGYDE